MLALTLAGCAKPSTGDASLPCRDRTPTNWDVELAPPGEPGDRLIVSGTVYRRGKLGPLAGVTVYAYHQDSKGAYFRAGREAAGPRLCGILRTDSLGRYRLRTIVPGGGEGDPHIHLEVWGRGVERQALVLNLPGHAARVPERPNPMLAWPPAVSRPEIPETMPAWPPAVGPSTREMTRDSSGVYHCTWDLEVK